MKLTPKRESVSRMDDYQKREFVHECKLERDREIRRIAPSLWRSRRDARRAEPTASWKNAIAHCIAGPGDYSPKLCGKDHDWQHASRMEDAVLCDDCQRILRWNDSTIPKIAQGIREGRD